MREARYSRWARLRGKEDGGSVWRIRSTEKIQYWRSSSATFRPLRRGTRNDRERSSTRCREARFSGLGAPPPSPRTQLLPMPFRPLFSSWARCGASVGRGTGAIWRRFMSVREPLPGVPRCSRGPWRSQAVPGPRCPSLPRYARKGECFMSAFRRFVGALAFLTLLPGRPVLAEGSRPGDSPPVQQSGGQPGPTDLEARIRQLEAKVRELAAALQALKDSSRPAETSRLEVLEKQIEALTREIERLKLGEAAASTAGESKHGFGPAASKVYQLRQGVSIGGYGELVYRNFAKVKDDGDASTETD